MPKGGYHILTKSDLRDRIKEIEGRIAQMDRREKALSDLKKWLSNRKLMPVDLLWMYKQMSPKRAAKPVTSRKPLQKTMVTARGLKIKLKGDPAFMAAIRQARVDKNWTTIDVSKKVGVSDASISNWEQGRYVPREDVRVKVLKVLGLPETLGAETTARMMSQNGRAAE